MSGCERKRESKNCTNEYANELNNFYARFDCHDFSKERDESSNVLNESLSNNVNKITIKDDIVHKTFKKTKPNKAPGPDGVSPKVLKYCASQLFEILQLSLTCL